MSNSDLKINAMISKWCCDTDSYDTKLTQKVTKGWHIKIISAIPRLLNRSRLVTCIKLNCRRHCSLLSTRAKRLPCVYFQKLKDAHRMRIDGWL